MEAGTAMAELNRQFEIPGIAKVAEGNGGLLKVSVTAPEATGEMYLLGANVTSWKPSGAEEALFVSAKSRWEDGIAIRGGVPIIFPWFGPSKTDPKAPQHGFARSRVLHPRPVAGTEARREVGPIARQEMRVDIDHVHGALLAGGLACTVPPVAGLKAIALISMSSCGWGSSATATVVRAGPS